MTWRVKWSCIYDFTLRRKALIKNAVGWCWSVLLCSTLLLHCWTAPLRPLLTLLFPLLGKADIAHFRQSTKRRLEVINFILKIILCIARLRITHILLASWLHSSLPHSLEKAWSRWKPRWKPLGIKYCEWLIPKFGVNHHCKCQTYYHQIFSRSCCVHLVAEVAAP